LETDRGRWLRVRANMRLPSQRAAATLVAVGAGALILSLFLDWYRPDLPSQFRGRPINVPTSYSAFEALERSDVYLVIAAVVALACAGVLVARVFPDSPAPALVIVMAGLFAVALVIYRGSSRPGALLFGFGPVDTTLRLGWFIALAAAASMLFGAVLAYLAGPHLRLGSDTSENGQETGDE
jgi:hypothetical protein